jgi:hypothetical protein
VLTITIAAAAIAQPAPPPYAHPARVEYLARALAAVQGLGAEGRRTLERELYQGARARCRAALATPSIACTVELATAICAPRADAAACRLAADVILTNARAETELVDEATRMKLVGSSTDYHTALLAEVAARHGALAAELVLAEAAPITAATLPARIDRFCAHREQGPDWQRCVAGLLWFVGSQEPIRSSGEGEAGAQYK